MKNLTVGFLSLWLVFTCLPIQSKAEKAKNDIELVASKNKLEVEAMVHRLEEIHAMDKSHLSSMEKKEYRKEVRAIQKQMKAQDGGGVYISVGALILIIILLIILL